MIRQDGKQGVQALEAFWAFGSSRLIALILIDLLGNFEVSVSFFFLLLLPFFYCFWVFGFLGSFRYKISFSFYFCVQSELLEASTERGKAKGKTDTIGKDSTIRWVSIWISCV